MRTALKLGIFLVLGAMSLVQAADDTNTFAVLECKNESFTNARISSVTAAYAIIFYDGGGKKVPLSDLPQFLQERYGYDANKAAQLLADEKKKKEAIANAYAQQLATETATQGERQKVRILKVLGNYIGDTRCEIDASGGQQEVLMSGGDFSNVQEYYSELDTLQSDAATSPAADSAGSTQPGYHGRNRAAMKAAAQRNNANNAANSKAIAAQLKALKAQGTNITTVFAAPTSQKYANLPIWIYLGKAAP
jgi:hypothetical protein